MKKVSTKIPAMIGMLLALAVIFFLTKGALYSMTPTLFDDGSSIYDPELTAWGSGLFALVVSAFSMIFYMVDAVLSAIKAFLKIHPIFNAVLAATILICTVFAVLIISNVLVTAVNLVWYMCYFAIFILEIVSIVKCCKQKGGAKNE